MRALCFHGLKAEQELESWVGFRSRLEESSVALRFVVSSPEAIGAMTADTDSSPQGEHLQLYEQEKRYARTWSVSRHPQLEAFPSDKNLHNFSTKLLTKQVAAHRDGRTGWDEALAAVPCSCCSPAARAIGQKHSTSLSVVPLLVYMCKTGQQVYLFASQKATCLPVLSLFKFCEWNWGIRN